MNEFGEPNMGNPSVRFDEGRERVGHWPFGLSIPPFLPTLRNGQTISCSRRGLAMRRTGGVTAKMELDQAKVSRSLFPLFPHVQFNSRFKVQARGHPLDVRWNAA